MTVTINPFGTHETDGVYLNEDGSDSDESFMAGASYLIHRSVPAHSHGDDAHGSHDDHADDTHGEEAHIDDAHGAHDMAPGDYANVFVDDKGYMQRKFRVLSGPDKGEIMAESFGPKAFGALFFFITGFHGFHVFSGVLFLLIIMLNAASGLYVARKNGYEMVEKIGLYWHFVDLVWVFVFLVFYLL